MSIFNCPNSKPLSCDEFRVTFDDGVLETANVRPGPGRPKQLLLGQRQQITRTISANLILSGANPK